MYKSIIRPCLFRIDAEKSMIDYNPASYISPSGTNKKPDPLTVSSQGCSLPMAKSELQQPCRIVSRIR